MKPEFFHIRDACLSSGKKGSKRGSRAIELPYRMRDERHQTPILAAVAVRLCESTWKVDVWRLTRSL